MNVFKNFSYLYFGSLVFFLILIDHTKNIYFILIFQLIWIFYFILIKKYKILILILLILYSSEFILLKLNIIHKDFNTLTFSKKVSKIYKPSSVIQYLYAKKLKPINYYDEEFVPISNIINSKIFNGRVENQLSYISSDELGFFNDNIKLNYKYIFLGDSFLNYTEIEKEKSFLYLLNNKLIYNMSIPNSGPLSQYAMVKEFINLPKFNSVKKIIWFHSEENDLARPYTLYKNKGGDLKIEYSLTLLKKYLNSTTYKQNIYPRLAKINKKLKIDKNLYKNSVNNYNNFFLINIFSNSFYFINKIFKNTPKKELIRNFEEDEIYYNSQLDIVNNILISMNKLLDQKKIELTIVILPDKFNCSINKSHFLNKKLLKILKSNNINYIDGKKAFVKGETCNTRNFNRYGHFSPLGHMNMSNFLKKTFK
jgi:hypothetical protein